MMMNNWSIILQPIIFWLLNVISLEKIKALQFRLPHKQATDTSPISNGWDLIFLNLTFLQLYFDMSIQIYPIESNHDKLSLSYCTGSINTSHRKKDI